MESNKLRSIQMCAKLKPTSPAPEEMIQVNVPGSKSITNRILLIAALGQGRVRVHNFLKSADTIAMLGAMSKLQIATFEYDENSSDPILIVNGNGGPSCNRNTAKLQDTVLHVNNSGTAARFLTTLAVVMSGKYKQPIHVTGNDQIKKRPIDPLVDALGANGCSIQYEESSGALPLRVHCVDGFAGGHIKLDAQISSQYVSSILMCAPYANQPVTLELCGHVISRSYIDMTIALMKFFGIHVTQTDDNKYQIPLGVYANPPEFIIEPDASTATYPMAVAAIMGRSVTIPHLGTRSIQGDAGFAREILKKMGCDVEQSETTTIVRGPPLGTLKSLGEVEVDMEPLTDTFLTAACLAAVAKAGVSTIRGIANQRVKECNRISAMVSQLAKFGVHAVEMDDGIKIFGQDYSNLTCAGSIHCFDDHRVAMSFSVLGCLIPCVIRDRFCTKKTWPEWWDVLSNTLHVQLNHVDIKDKVKSELTGNISQNSPPSSNCKDKTIILIGMRGVGKTTIGRMAANRLSKHFVDMDEEFSRVYNTSANEYIKLNGWEAFRSMELNALLTVVNKYPTNCIVACGGGLVETEDARALLRSLNDSFIVIHLRRNLQNIVQDPSFRTKIAYGEDVAAVWERRKPWYQQLSSKEFFVTDSGTSVESDRASEFEEVFQQMAAFIGRCSDGQWVAAKFSQTTSPTLPIYSIRFDLTSNEWPNLQAKWKSELSTCASLYNLIELRFVIPEGQIGNEEEVQNVIEQVGEHYFFLKRISNLPVVLTCISTEESFLTSHTSTFINSLAVAASKWSIDLICFDETISLRLSTIIKDSITISKLHTATLYQGPDVDTVLNKTSYNIIATPKNSSKEHRQHRHSEEIIHVDGAQNQGMAADLYLVPSTSTNVDQLVTKLKSINLKVVESANIQQRQFYLFGSPISKSKSPLLHNTGFDAVELPYKYSRYEAAQIESAGIEALMKRSDFGGASVTIPLKEKIGQFLDEITDAGGAIGAINTIFRNPDGKLVGDNTDYIGMLQVLQPALQAMEESDQELRGMIIGAGGTARAAIYAFLSIPQIKHVTIVNRSVDKALALVQEFKQKQQTRKDVGFEADSLESLNCVCFDDLHHPHLIISTIPADAQATCKFSKQLFKDTSAVVEMVYGLKTPLLQAVEDFNSKNQSQVAVCTGGQVLIEQGLRQFVIWTGLTLPFDEMRTAVEKAFEIDEP